MKGIKSYIIAGILFVSAFGTFLHFAYDLSGNNILVGLLTPINESIWEHTKLLFFPMLLYALFLIKKLKDEYPCIGSAMMSATFLGILLIIILFYTYSGIIGHRVAFVDISIFYISVITSFYIAYQLTLSCKMEPFTMLLHFLTILLICLFLVFTFKPPDIPLFVNPKA